METVIVRVVVVVLRTVNILVYMAKTRQQVFKWARALVRPIIQTIRCDKYALRASSKSGPFEFSVVRIDEHFSVRFSLFVLVICGKMLSRFLSSYNE
jgi:hypothetical protein